MSLERAGEAQLFVPLGGRRRGEVGCILVPARQKLLLEEEDEDLNLREWKNEFSPSPRERDDGSRIFF